jgi:uncharacterized protein (DUF433 family)
MEPFDFTNSPLRQDAEGTIRVIGSRVTFDTLINIWKRGDTLEEIHEGFPTLSLDQIKAVIAWYLNHTAAADEYLEQEEAEAEALRKEIQSQPSYIEFNAEIKRRWEQILRQREQLIKS